jgi:hypothetical protein
MRENRVEKSAETTSGARQGEARRLHLLVSLKLAHKKNGDASRFASRIVLNCTDYSEQHEFVGCNDIAHGLEIPGRWLLAGRNGT